MPCFRTVCVLGLMLHSINVNAETWTLLPKLTMTPPADLDVSFQSLEELDLEGNHIVGWQGEEADFFVLAVDWEKGFGSGIAWTVMMADLRLDSDLEDLTVVTEGDYKTDLNYTIKYKLVEHKDEGDTVTQYLTSIEHANGAFMLIANSFSNDREYLTKSMRVLAKSVRISK